MKNVTILRPKDENNENYWRIDNDNNTASLWLREKFTGISACLEKRTNRGITLHNYYTLGSGITKIFLSKTEWKEENKEENGGKEEEEL